MVRSGEPYLFDDIFGEQRLRSYQLGRRVEYFRFGVGYSFRGKSLDAYTKDPAFQLFAERFAAQSSFCFFSMPDDAGVQAILRAWWLKQNPKLNLEKDYEVFAHDASKRIIEGAKEAFWFIEDPPFNREADVLDYFTSIFEAVLLKSKGRLSKLLKK